MADPWRSKIIFRNESCGSGLLLLGPSLATTFGRKDILPEFSSDRETLFYQSECIVKAPLPRVYSREQHGEEVLFASVHRKVLVLKA